MEVMIGMKMRKQPDVAVANGIEGVDSALVLLDGDAVLPAALQRSENR